MAAGRLLIIGGHEDKDEEPAILREFARLLDGGCATVATVASEYPEESFEAYDRVFRRLGVAEVAHLDIADRDDGFDEERVELVRRSSGVFFTGGDQLRITSKFGDTPCFRALVDRFERDGIVVAGTSAGASVMSETMLVRGNGSESHRIGDVIRMAPGLGLIKGVVIDQHFAERGRIGRLLGAVAQNPRMLGLGIDEDTAILVTDGHFEVRGSGAVYVADAQEVRHSNVTAAERDETLSIFDVRLHLLSAGDAFDLQTRRPEGGAPPDKQAHAEREREPVGAAADTGIEAAGGTERQSAESGG